MFHRSSPCPICVQVGDITPNHTIYQNTRKFVLSKDNPWFFKGTLLEGEFLPLVHGLVISLTISIARNGRTTCWPFHGVASSDHHAWHDVNRR